MYLIELESHFGILATLFLRFYIRTAKLCQSSRLVIQEQREDTILEIFTFHINLYQYSPPVGRHVTVCGGFLLAWYI